MKQKPEIIKTNAEWVAKNPGYTILRIDGGYAVYKGAEKVTDANVFAITISKLERLIRKDLGI